MKQMILTVAFAIQLTGIQNVALAKSTELKPQVVKSIDADSAFEELKMGNQRFLTGKTRKDGQAAKDIVRLSSEQAPNSVVLSCSDSRVPPEAVFDQKLGEMFTVRSAGETLSPEAIASIEFAIAKLGTHLVVVMGHTNCGAVKAAVETIEGKSAGSESLDKLVADIRPQINSGLGEHHPSKNLKAESWLNAKGVAKDLVRRSSLLSKAVENGKVKVQVGLYDLETGSVEFE